MTKLTDRQKILELKEFYSYKKISSQIGCSVQTISNIVNKKTGNLQVHLASKLESMLQNHMNEHSEKLTIPQIMELDDRMVMVDSPQGFSLIAATYIKPEAQCVCVRYVMDNGKTLNTNSIECSENHQVVALRDGEEEWVKVKDLTPTDKIKTKQGFINPYISNTSIQEVYDITVDNESNSYWVEDVLSHNCGKTFIINKIIGNFQKESPDHWGVIFDTEAACEPNAVRNVGGDPTRIKVFPVDTVEACRNQLCKFLDAVIEKGPTAYGKYIVAIDSLGNLASQKEVDDAAKDKHAVDMGMRAKAMKSMLRTVTYKAAKAGVTILFSNHTYDDPAAMFPSLVKSQAGGKGPIYMASLLVQLAISQEKSADNDDETIAISKKYNGVNLRALTVKNRFIPAMLETELSLNFKTGLNKYSGILNMAKSYEIIKVAGPVYTWGNGDKLGQYGRWKKDPKVWAEIINRLEPVLQEELRYNDESIINTEEENIDLEEIND